MFNNCSGSVGSLIVGTAALAAAGGMAYINHYYNGSDNQILQRILNADEEDLATSFVCDDDAIENRRRERAIVKATVDAYVNDGDYGGPVPSMEDLSDYSALLDNVVKYTLEPIEEKNHRRVNRKRNYTAAVIAEVKVRFGVAKRSAANERAIQRYAAEIMRKHGVRHTVVRKLLPIITEAIFIPDKWEVEAARISNCYSAVAAKVEYHSYAMVSGAQRF